MIEMMIMRNIMIVLHNDLHMSRKELWNEPTTSDYISICTNGRKSNGERMKSSSFFWS